MTTLLHSQASQDHGRLGHDEFVAPNLLARTEDGAGGDDITAGQKMLSAMSGSLLTSLLMTPLDVVRVRLQSQNIQQPVVDFSKLQMTTANLKNLRTSELGITACCREVFFMNNNAEYCLASPPRIHGGVVLGGGAARPPAECAVEEVQQKTISSTLDGLRKIARNEGITTLWRGLSPTLVMAVPANIIYFTGYDWLRYSARSPIARAVRDDYAPLVAGASARVLAATAVGPIELFRTRMQASSGSSATGHFTDTLRGVQDMVRGHGYRSLWRGLTLTLWRDVPFSGFYWWGYETVRGALTDAREARRGRRAERRSAEDGRPLSAARRRSQSRGSHADTFVDSFTAGAVSGALASIITMPFDVGKTRTQVYRESPGAAAAAAAPEELSMTRLLWHIFRTEGIAGLWRGWIPRTLKVAPACAIMISSYEVGKRAFRGVNERARKEGLS